MRIGLLIAQFESGFASSFKHTARVQYDVDFDSSTVSNILSNLQLLKENILAERKRDIQVPWEMSIEHVLMLEVTLNQIITKYEELFFIRPLDSKIYLVNNKLIESELPCPKDFAKDAIQHIFKPDSGKKISKREQKKIAADSISFNRAMKSFNKR